MNILLIPREFNSSIVISGLFVNPAATVATPSISPTRLPRNPPAAPRVPVTVPVPTTSKLNPLDLDVPIPTFASLVIITLGTLSVPLSPHISICPLSVPPVPVTPPLYNI